MNDSKVKTLTDDNFESIVGSGISVVDFWAAWCGPCKMQKPIIEEFSNKMGDRINVCEVDIDQNQPLAAKYQVSSIPTIIVFKDGKVVQQTAGLRTLEDLEGMVQAVS